MTDSSPDPSSASYSKKRIAIVGDLKMDWLLFITAMNEAIAGTDVKRWSQVDDLVIRWQPGGATLVGDMLFATLRADEPNLNKSQLYVPPIPDNAIATHTLPSVTHIMSLWRKYERATEARDSSDNNFSWRLNRYIGQSRISQKSLEKTASDNKMRGHHELIVVDDSGYGFRTCSSLWPSCLKGSCQDKHDIVLKMSRELSFGELWNQMTALEHRTISVYAEVATLRAAGCRIGQSLSWEQMASDV